MKKSQRVSLRQLARLAALTSLMAAAGCAPKDRAFEQVDETASLGTAPDSIDGSSGTTDAPAIVRGPGGTEGEPGTAPLDLSPGDASEGPNDADQLTVVGEFCEGSDECESGFCVEGLCCESACTELCATCAATGSEGRCTAAASDPQCNELSCPPGSACRRYDQTGVALNCEALGSCKPGVECLALDEVAGAPCQDGAGECDGLGACVVAGRASLGEACATDDDCAEGNCVAGAGGTSICCDSACDGVCQQCSEAGRCDTAPLDDPACDAVACPPDNPCRDYQDTIAEELCQGFGQCRTAQACAFEPLRPNADCSCDASGSCRLRRGVRCDEASQCSSGACQASGSGTTICCAAACPEGSFCAADGSRCVACEGNEARCDGNLALRCDGTRFVPESCANGCTNGSGCNARAPAGFSCVTSQCVPGAVCQNDQSDARRCCSRDCSAEGKECAVDGSCVCPPGQTQGAGSSCLLQRGDPCGNGSAACGTGLTCVDGTCCDSACNAACESCNLPGSVGRCSFNARDNAQCGGGEECVGRGDCRSTAGETCNQGGDCLLGNCEPLVGVSGVDVCCAQSCTGARPFCTSDGGRCVQCQSNADCDNGCNQGTCNPLRGLGNECNVARQCQSGVCLPDVNDARTNRCCPNCRAGQLCSSNGQCQDPPLDAGANCSQDSQCAGGLFCRDGVCCTSRCDRPCESCSGGTGLCNLIPTSDPQRCGAVPCTLQSNSCRTVTPPQAAQCAALGQCVGNAQCTVQNFASGTPCSGNGQCDGAGNCAVDTTAPSVGGGTIAASGTGFDDRTVIWSAANDGSTGTLASQLEYVIYHSFSDTLGTLQQTLAATEVAETIGTTSQLIRLPRLANSQRSAQHFLNVVVSDAANNRALYTRLAITLTDPASCTGNDQCIGGTCITLFADVDGDCRGNPNSTMRTCAAPTLSTSSCPQPRAALSGLAGVTPSGGTTRFVNNSLDCVDGNSSVYQGQPRFFATGFTPPAGSGRDPFDYNCSDAVEPALPDFAGCAGTVPDGSGSGTCERADGTSENGYSPGAACGSANNAVIQCVTSGVGNICGQIGNISPKACH